MRCRWPAIILWPDTALTRSALTCVAKKVVIVDAPSGGRASQSEEHLSFWIDEAGKTITFVDGVPLSVRRFDAQWISATYEDVSPHDIATPEQIDQIARMAELGLNDHGTFWRYLDIVLAARRRILYSSLYDPFHYADPAARPQSGLM